MSWPSNYAIFLDIEKPGSPLLSGKYSSSLTSTIQWTQGDQFPLHIYFQQRGQQGEASANQQLPGTHSVLISGKQVDNGVLIGETLVENLTFTENQDDDDDYFYKCDLNLDTAQLDALFAVSATSKTLQLDIEVQDGAGKPLTFRVPVSIAPQSYDGSGDPPNARSGGPYQAQADVDWISTGAIDVPVPDPMIPSEILVYNDGDSTGLTFTLGTVASPSLLGSYALVLAYPGVLNINGHKVLTGGILRLNISTGAADGTGKIIVRGISL
ncbi:hypothetical protein P0Y35_08770 [Kiritimatiellaeota bacterium B1221]|nr:hypothetical protein [Kiritimatiellaeota bacterium B1221]